MKKLLTLVLLMCLLACQSESGKTSLPKEVELLTPSGETIKTTLAITPAEQEQGLSGVKPEDFDDNQALFFWYDEEDEKNFWMPDTYFDLDIIFLDRELKIVDIVRKLPFYVGRANSSLIPRARAVWSRHAIEMKSTSPISQKLMPGDKLTWKAGVTLEQFEQKLKKP